MSAVHDIVVLGAGLSGLTAARGLADRGREVLVLDKGRSPGGRLAHRARSGFGFDHGSPWVEPHGGAFADYLRCACAEGAAERVCRAPARIAGLPRMGAVLAPLAEGIELRQEVEVTGARLDGARWRLSAPGGEIEARALVSTVPSPQAARLFPELADRLSSVTMLPCWTLMAAFDEPLGVPAPEWPDNGARVIREPDKPGRRDRPEAWTMHAPALWSAENLERDREEIVPDLLRMFSRAIARRLPEPLHARAHRWRYARTGRPLGEPFLTGKKLRVGGDWCLGPSAEHAFESGRSIAADLAG